jgi:dTDP-L-rhamnose 4-epimerase
LSSKYGSVLLTGGAGFIGSHTTALLLREGYEVRVIDNLDPQVHGTGQIIPKHLLTSASMVVGDIRNKQELSKALSNVDAVVHLASVVGVGQSMYQIERYLDCNTRGTATLLDLLVNSDHRVKKLIVASSMSVYGEGKYHCERCESFQSPIPRENPNAQNWEHRCGSCGAFLKPVPTDEEIPLRPASIYAMSKRHQEELCLLTGRTYGLPTTALRFFNVYGKGQALSNPYTGAIAIFLSRILNGKPPYLFEDGQQLRDFISVNDVARSVLFALRRDDAAYLPVNIGSGQPTSILEIAKTLAAACGIELKPIISNRFRKGDIRHCYADVRRAKDLLGFQARMPLRAQLDDLVEWAKSENSWRAETSDSALKELEEKRLA